MNSDDWKKEKKYERWEKLLEFYLDISQRKKDTQDIVSEIFEQLIGSLLVLLWF